MKYFPGRSVAISFVRSTAVSNSSTDSAHIASSSPKQPEKISYFATRELPNLGDQQRDQRFTWESATLCEHGPPVLRYKDFVARTFENRQEIVRVAQGCSYGSNEGQHRRCTHSLSKSCYSSQPLRTHPEIPPLLDTSIRVHEHPIGIYEHTYPGANLAAAHYSRKFQVVERDFASPHGSNRSGEVISTLP